MQSNPLGLGLLPVPIHTEMPQVDSGQDDFPIPVIEQPADFLEDRFPTLDRLRDLERTRLYLVDWGYSTPAERERARHDADIEVLDGAGFASLLARSRGPG